MLGAVGVPIIVAIGFAGPAVDGAADGDVPGAVGVPIIVAIGFADAVGPDDEDLANGSGGGAFCDPVCERGRGNVGLLEVSPGAGAACPTPTAVDIPTPAALPPIAPDAPALPLVAPDAVVGAALLAANAPDADAIVGAALLAATAPDADAVVGAALLAANAPDADAVVGLVTGPMPGAVCILAFDVGIVVVDVGAGFVVDAEEADVVGDGFVAEADGADDVGAVDDCDDAVAVGAGLLAPDIVFAAIALAADGFALVLAAPDAVASPVAARAGVAVAVDGVVLCAPDDGAATAAAETAALESPPDVLACVDFAGS